MDTIAYQGNGDGRIADVVLGAFVLFVVGVAIFRRKRNPVDRTSEPSEEWEEYLGV
jgi:hypothetical protein